MTMLGRVLLLGAALALVAGCGDDTTGSGGGGGAGTTSGTGGATSASTSASGATTTATGATSAASTSSAATSGAGGGLGAFGASCSENTDCESNVCFNFNANGPHCTETCTTAADCPNPNLGCNGMGYCKIQ